jgi:hypothetical protein
MLYVLMCDGMNKVKMITLKVCDEIKEENVGLISPPTAHWALDLRPDRGRPSLTGWQAPVTLRDIKRGGGRRLAPRGSPPDRASTENPNPI